MIELGRQMHEASTYAPLKFSPAKCVTMAGSAMNNENLFAFVAEDEETLELYGMIIGMVYENFFCEGKISGDLLLYVHPDKRGGTIGIRLLKLYEAWAKKQGVILITLGISTGTDIERTAALYEKMGYEKVGYQFTKKEN